MPSEMPNYSPLGPSSYLQLRVVSATKATLWWRVLCRPDETIGTVRERLLSATGATSGAIKLYHNGVALDDRRTVEACGLNGESVLAGSRTQSVVFGLQVIAKLKNDVFDAMTPRRPRCCEQPTTTANRKTVKWAHHSSVVPRKLPADTKASARRVSSSAAATVQGPRGVTGKKEPGQAEHHPYPLVSRGDAAESVSWLRQFSHAVRSLREVEHLAESSAVKDSRSASYIRLIKTPQVPLNLDLFAPVATNATAGLPLYV